MTSVALTQGDELTVVLAVVVVGALLLQVGTALLESTRGPSLSRLSARQAAAALAAIGVLVVVVGVAAGAPGRLADAWDEFRSPAAQSAIEHNNDPSRLASLSSNGRYQLWSVAADTLERNPLTGTGAGTYEFTWLRETTMGGTVLDAHSLYLETGAETGIPGLLLIIALVLVVLSVGASVGRLSIGGRWLTAGALGSFAAFAAAAGIDWLWEIPVIPLAALLVGAAALATVAPDDRTGRGGANLWRRGVVVASSLVAIIVLTLVLTTASSLGESQASVRDGSLPTADRYAVDAHAISPGAASPLLQLALVREQRGDVDTALAAAVEATRREPANWRTWLTRSRLEAKSSEPEAAVASFRRARELNPFHTLFRK